MGILNRIAEECAELLGTSKNLSEVDKTFEHAVLTDPSKTHVDITSNNVHKQAIEYNKGMNSQAMLRGEISYYLQWAALGLFGALLGAGVTGQFGNLMTALTSFSGIAVMVGAVALAGAAIYMKINNTRIQSEKNMNLGEFEMRRSAKIMAKELAQELKHDQPGAESPAPERVQDSKAWGEFIAAQRAQDLSSSPTLH